ncbi:uncharacterized protein [Magallana gigas]|uniref:uncharacterized protein n=1 Tax=Magallana gigas TaxID=29159 RepID=UPI003341141A
MDGTPFSDENHIYSEIPDIPETVIPTEHPIYVATRAVFSKDSINDLPIQHAYSSRRMENLDEDEYGYTTGVTIHNKLKNDLCLEDTFMDALEFFPYKKENHNPMISRSFFSPQGNYGGMSVAKISEEIDSFPMGDQLDLKKFITVQLLPSLKLDNKITEVLTLFSCKNRHVRNLCIQETTEMVLFIDHRRFSRKDLFNLYETGTVQLYTAIAETKKSLPVFQHLIQLGIMFNCFIYLNAIQALDVWIPRIRRVMDIIQSKSKRMLERNDPDVEVFVKTAQCIFGLENVDLDDSLLLGEDVDDFLPEFSREDGNIYIEGLAALFHTGNLILRQQSKLIAGVQKLVGLSSFMNGSNDEGLVKWFNRLLGQFVIRTLQQEHPDVKQDVHYRCEDELFSIFKSDTFHSEGLAFSHSLFFHHNESIRTRYRAIARKKGVYGTVSVTDTHLQGLLEKCGLFLDLTNLQSKSTLKRKQCTICDVNASITCFYETFQFESKDVNMHDNTSAANLSDIKTKYIKENLENELEVLKEIESKHFQSNVTRLLAFSQSLPKFYIKERLPGDNLQRRLLEAREKRKIIPIVDLIRIIIQAVKAVIYVHRQECLLRDITTASYGCTVSDDGYFVKLKNFEMAARPSDLSDGGIISGIIDLDFSGVPVRWAAPESLLEGHYSIHSDVWSFNILADEILNYAAWPYSDISDADINDMVTHIVFTHLKPQGFNRPRRVQGLILEGLATIPEQRLKLEALRERLIEILENIDGGNSYSLYDTYSRVEGSRTKIYDIPPLTERQKQANSVFERVGLISFSPSSLFLSLFLSHGITFLIDINREFRVRFKSTESSKTMSFYL